MNYNVHVTKKSRSDGLLTIIVNALLTYTQNNNALKGENIKIFLFDFFCPLIDTLIYHLDNLI